ncbi:MAG: phosphoesterase [gamma proteobacterium symbiont of Taylorina sp.]|nr:phosphoesterase [gamma proteobacterium symbiont of Taylorina sp.]
MKKLLQHPVIIIYHGNCPDGFAAALAADLFFRQYHNHHSHVSYYKGRHGNPSPDCQGKEVYIVDFSYHRKEMKSICQQALKVTLIDHHISAEKELQQLESEHNNLKILFDMSQSGAILSWKFFHTTPPPKLFEHIQDNDLWQFKLNRTRCIIMAIMSYPMEFELWSKWLESEEELLQLYNEGTILERQTNKLIERYKPAARQGKIAGYTIPVVNAPGSIGSELLHQLSDGYPFAAAYEDKRDKRVWQLRSGGKKAIDVSEIAQQFGGGGHKNASGFSTTHFTVNLDPPAQ